MSYCTPNGQNVGLATMNLSRLLRSSLVTILVAGACAGTGNRAPTGSAAGDAAADGLDVRGIDRSVAPGDDCNAFANGTGIRTTEIPADRSAWSVFGMLDELTARRTADLIAETGRMEAPPGSDARKVGDYYASFMDEAGIEAKGLPPLQPTRDRIAATSDPP